MEDTAKRLLSALAARGYTMATAESCTGGNIAHRITLVPGSSEYYMGGVVSYSNDVKQHLLGVPAEDLAACGAVSHEVVQAMAEGAAKACGANCAVATSGIAGPGGAVPGKPVGTVWIAAYAPHSTMCGLFHFDGDRASVIDQATETALLMLIDAIREY